MVHHPVAAALFGLCFLVLAVGRVGRLQLPRGPVAFVAGLFTAALLGLSWRVIDWDVIALLAGLMALAGLAEAAGLFSGLRRRLLNLPPGLALWVALAVVALASALLLNDAAVVVLTPFLLPVLRNLGLRPVPAVAFIAVAANAGSLLTPFGNPQNAVLAGAGGLGVLDFLRVQGPWVLLAMALLGAAAWREGRRAVPPEGGARPVPPQAARGRPAVVAGIVAFLALAVAAPRTGIGLGAAALACAAGTWLLLRLRLGREADRAAVRGLDWNVIALFLGLYLLTAGLEQWFPAASLDPGRLDDPWSALAVTTVLSNLVGNVPATLVFLELDPAWTRLHAPFLVTVTTLGGALFLTGSAASLLAADQAKRLGVEVRFLPFLRLAAPWTLPVLLLGAWATW